MTGDSTRRAISADWDDDNDDGTDFDDDDFDDDDFDDDDEEEDDDDLDGPDDDDLDEDFDEDDFDEDDEDEDDDYDDGLDFEEDYDLLSRHRENIVEARSQPIARRPPGQRDAARTRAPNRSLRRARPQRRNVAQDDEATDMEE